MDEFNIAEYGFRALMAESRARMAESRARMAESRARMAESEARLDVFKAMMAEISASLRSKYRSTDEHSLDLDKSKSRSMDTDEHSLDASTKYRFMDMVEQSLDASNKYWSMDMDDYSLDVRTKFRSMYMDEHSLDARNIYKSMYRNEHRLHARTKYRYLDTNEHSLDAGTKYWSMDTDEHSLKARNKYRSMDTEEHNLNTRTKYLSMDTDEHSLNARNKYWSMEMDEQSLHARIKYLEMGDHSLDLARIKYKFTTAQMEVNPYMRNNVAGWMLEVCQKMGSSRKSFCLAMRLMDRILADTRIAKNKLKLLGVTCLLVASKFTETVPISVYRLVSDTDDSITIQELREMEMLILTTLDLNYHTTSLFSPWGLSLDEYFETKDASLDKLQKEKPIDNLIFQDSRYKKIIKPNIIQTGTELMQSRIHVDASNNNIPTVMLLGLIGAGKSSFGNAIVDDTQKPFDVGVDAELGTEKVQEYIGSLMYHGNCPIRIIDTPGFDDVDGRDASHILSIVDFLSGECHVNAFVLILEEFRHFNKSFKDMLKKFEMAFGDKFWQNLLIKVPTKVNEEAWMKKIAKEFPSANISKISILELDINKSMSSENFVETRKSLRVFYEEVKRLPPFDCGVIKPGSEQDGMMETLYI